MPIAGLYALMKQFADSAQWNRARAAACRTDPRIAHDLEAAAKKDAAEAERLGKHAKSNEELIQNIEMLIAYLNNSTIKSGHRTLALRDLESASDRLRRELGSPA